eukprot:scaffold3541_cov116-Cylindrotheca_fusiformis.AAC.4
MGSPGLVGGSPLGWIQIYISQEATAFTWVILTNGAAIDVDKMSIGGWFSLHFSLGQSSLRVL